MSKRGEQLAVEFEQVSSQIQTVAERLSNTDWNTIPAGEARTVGQILYHIAELYANVGGFVRLATAGQPLPPLTMDLINQANAEQAARYSGAGREAALEILRQNAVATAALLRSLSDAQLDLTAVFLSHPITVEGLAQNGLVDHSKEHLASIQSALA